MGVEESGRLADALGRLVERGTLDRAQADAVLSEYGKPGEAPKPESVRRRLGEIAGYLGASLLVGAILLFLAETWDMVGRSGRVTVLGILTVVLFGGGVVLRRDDEVRRRLSSTLMTGAAIAAGFGMDAALDDVVPAEWLMASIAATLVVTAGYLLARSALGQLGMAVGALAILLSLVDLLNVDDTVDFGLGMIGLGVLWAVLYWRHWVVERRFALAIAVSYGVIGSQLMLTAEGLVKYLPTLLMAVVCFGAYVWVREWVVLAGGVIAATLVVPEFLYDVTDGSLGAGGVMLISGITLLGASMAGLRMRRVPPPDPDLTAGSGSTVAPVAGSDPGSAAVPSAGTDPV
ncbi:DUF2157 domain-containing protein [Actinoplanes sp. NPDC051851]|uniref:DUF2157 domain-containing protein n=1 Tax=Actinoplanes sp. NPDC051851 TaxID=3154753 RepID=UPI0034130293